MPRAEKKAAGDTDASAVLLHAASVNAVNYDGEDEDLEENGVLLEGSFNEDELVIYLDKNSAGTSFFLPTSWRSWS